MLAVALLLLVGVVFFTRLHDPLASTATAVESPGPPSLTPAPSGPVPAMPAALLTAATSAPGRALSVDEQYLIRTIRPSLGENARLHQLMGAIGQNKLAQQEILDATRQEEALIRANGAAVNGFSPQIRPEYRCLAGLVVTGGVADAGVTAFLAAFAIGARAENLDRAQQFLDVSDRIQQTLTAELAQADQNKPLLPVDEGTLTSGVMDGSGILKTYGCSSLSTSYVPPAAPRSLATPTVMRGATSAPVPMTPSSVPATVAMTGASSSGPGISPVSKTFPIPPGVEVADPAAHLIYVVSDSVNSGPGSVTLVDAATAQAVGTIPVGIYPWAAAADTSSHMLYVANRNSGTVSVIDGPARKLVATVSVEMQPDSVVVDQSSHAVYVACSRCDKVAVLDGATHQVVSSVLVGPRLKVLAADPDSHRVYVSGDVSGDQPDVATIYVLDGGTRRVIASIPVPTDNVAVAVDGAAHLLYVLQTDRGSVDVYNAATNARLATLMVVFGIEKWALTREVGRPPRRRRPNGQSSPLAARLSLDTQGRGWRWVRQRGRAGAAAQRRRGRSLAV